MVFAGTAIANGSCTVVVTAIGMSTEIGKIQAQISEAAKEDDDTPLKKKLNEFGEMLAKVLSGSETVSGSAEFAQLNLRIRSSSGPKECAAAPVRYRQGSGANCRT